MLHDGHIFVSNMKRMSNCGLTSQCHWVTRTDLSNLGPGLKMLLTRVVNSGCMSM